VNGPENAASFFTRVFIFWEKLFFVDDDLGWTWTHLPGGSSFIDSSPQPRTTISNDEDENCQRAIYHVYDGYHYYMILLLSISTSPKCIKRHRAKRKLVSNKNQRNWQFCAAATKCILIAINYALSFWKKHK
jgi:hypothetical protein